MSTDEWQGSRWAEMVLNQARIPTLEKKLVITICPVGALVSRTQNPNQPRTPQEIADGTVAAYREGASVVHFHNRNEHGHPVTNTEIIKETVDRILDKCPDIVIQPSSCHGYVPGAQQYTYETVKPMVDALHGINPRYMESTIFTPVSYALQNVGGDFDITLATEKNAVETVRYLQDNGVKPEFMCHNWEGIMNVNEWLVKPGILQKPYLMSMGPGMHNAAETHVEPWWVLYVLGMMPLV